MFNPYGFDFEWEGDSDSVTWSSTIWHLITLKLIRVLVFKVEFWCRHRGCQDSLIQFSYCHYALRVYYLSRFLFNPHFCLQIQTSLAIISKCWELGFGGHITLLSTCNAGDPNLISGSGRSTGEGIGYLLQYSWGSLVAQLVKNPPVMQETWVRSLGWEDPLEKGNANHSSVLAWRIPWTV